MELFGELKNTWKTVSLKTLSVESVQTNVLHLVREIQLGHTILRRLVG